jgi:hypothetical protein
MEAKLEAKVEKVGLELTGKTYKFGLFVLKFFPCELAF